MHLAAFVFVGLFGANVALAKPCDTVFELDGRLEQLAERYERPRTEEQKKEFEKGITRPVTYYSIEDHIAQELGETGGLQFDFARRVSVRIIYQVPQRSVSEKSIEHLFQALEGHKEIFHDIEKHHLVLKDVSALDLVDLIAKLVPHGMYWNHSWYEKSFDSFVIDLP